MPAFYSPSPSLPGRDTTRQGSNLSCVPVHLGELSDWETSIFSLAQELLFETLAGDPWHGGPLARPWELPFFDRMPKCHTVRKFVRWQDSQISYRPCCEFGDSGK